jgi:hypothetical protein
MFLGQKLLPKIDSKGSFISAEYNNQFPKGFFDATLSEVMELNLHG